MADLEQDAELQLRRSVSCVSSSTKCRNDAKCCRREPDNGRDGTPNKSLEFKAEDVEHLMAKVAKAGNDDDIISTVERTARHEQETFPSAFPRYKLNMLDSLKTENIVVETKRLRRLLSNMLLKDYFTEYQCSFASEILEYYRKIAICIHLAAASSSRLLSPNWVCRRTFSDILRRVVQGPAYVLDLPTDVVLAMILRMYTLSNKGRAAYGGCIVPLIESGNIQALAEKIWIDRNVVLPAFAHHVPYDDDPPTTLLLAKRMDEVKRQHFKSIGEGVPVPSITARRWSLELVRQYIGEERRYKPTSWLNTRIGIARRQPEKHPGTTILCSYRRSYLRASEHLRARMRRTSWK